MSDDFLETIWAQYAIETDEHIESIESLLVKADAAPLNAEEVSGLFRAFHSLKGLSRVMELGALESVAHRCEDLLGMVREGTAALDKNTIDLLLRSLDAIQLLCQKAVAERSDGEKPAALLAELERAFKMLSQGQALTGPEPAKALPAALVPTPSRTPQDLHASQAAAVQAHGQTTPDAQGVTAPTPTVLMHAVREACGHLENLANTMASPDDGAAVWALAQDMREPLSRVHQAAVQLGHADLGARMEDILQALPLGTPISAADSERMLDALVALCDELTTLPPPTGEDGAQQALTQALARALQDKLGQQLSQLDALLQALQAPGELPNEEVAQRLSQRFLRTHAHLSTLYPQSNTDVPLLLADAFARATGPALGMDPQIIALCGDVLQFMRDVFACLAQQGQLSAPLKATDEALTQRIRAHLWAHHEAGEMPMASVRQCIAALDMPTALSELLSADNMRELAQLVQDGHRAYLVKAHLESSQTLATAFLAWVHATGRVITNRTLIENDLSWYEILFVSQAPRALIGQALRDMDAGTGHVFLLCELTAGHDLPPPLADTTSAPESSAEQAAPKVAVRAPSQDAAAATPAAASASSNVIRVPGEMLDQFMNQIGEMVLVRGQLAHIIGDQRVRESLNRLRQGQDTELKDPQSLLLQLQQVAEGLDQQWRRLQETDALIQGALSRLQDSVMGLRVVPVELVFKRFARMVRDLALAQGKKIRLELLGQDVKIDKAMVESLADPLLHMVRNSADHGVELPAQRRQAGKPEEAVIRIQAVQQGSRIMIRVSDDGQGIDPERVRRKAIAQGLVKEADSLQMSKEDILGFIFRPAFSTTDVVTETSGRGVGMDVVRTSVMRMGGTIDLDSQVGKGTTFTMHMPLSAAVQEVLLVTTAQQTMAIPGRYVAELIEVSAQEYQTVKGRTAILLRGHFLPIVRLEELLGYPHEAQEIHRYVVVLSDGQRSLGVSVQALLGRQELFTKDIHPRLAALPGVGGASILGDGRVVLILDAAALYRLAENLPPPHHLPLNA